MKEIIIKSIKNKLIKTVLVDDEDFEYLNRWSWSLFKSGRNYYAKRLEPNSDGSSSTIYMHRVIMGVYDSKIEIDHKDRNGLNNTKGNLRYSNSEKNKFNRTKKTTSKSKYLGVSICSRKYPDGSIHTRWKAGIYSKGVKEPKKKFPFTEEGEMQAAKYYDQIAKNNYGEFANLNFKN
jgi:hypothetical protein